MLGNDSLSNSPIPVQVQGLTAGVAAVAVGDLHACAVVDGGVQCWGYDNYGQLGTTDVGPLGYNTVPKPVTAH